MNRNVKLLIASTVLSNFHMFGVLLIPLLISKGIAAGVALSLVAVYNISNVLLEVPTGIIGDKFGQRASVVAGFIVKASGLIALTFVQGELACAAALALSATGESLNSGSNTGIIKSVSDNYKSDFRTESLVKQASFMFSYIAAGFLGYISLQGAIMIQAFGILLAIIPIMMVSSKNLVQRNTDNLSIIKSAINLPSVLSRIKEGFILIIMIAMAQGYVVNSRFITSSFEDVYSLDIRLIGLLVSAGMLARIAGTYAEKYLKWKRGRLFAVMVATIAFTSVIAYSRPVGIALLLVSIFFAEMLHYRSRYVLSERADKKTIASVMSVGSLSFRAGTAGLVLMAGYFTSRGNLDFYFIATPLVFIGIYLTSKFVSKYVANSRTT